jgi:hypothetical protein
MRFPAFAMRFPAFVLRLPAFVFRPSPSVPAPLPPACSGCPSSCRADRRRWLSVPTRPRKDSHGSLVPRRPATGHQGRRNFTALVGFEGPRPNKCRGVAESAGIDRLGGGDGRALRRRAIQNSRRFPALGSIKSPGHAALKTVRASQRANFCLTNHNGALCASLLDRYDHA